MHANTCDTKNLHLVTDLVVIFIELDRVVEVVKYTIMMWYLTLTKKKYTIMQWTNILIFLFLGGLTIYKTKSKIVTIFTYGITLKSITLFFTYYTFLREGKIQCDI